MNKIYWWVILILCFSVSFSDVLANEKFVTIVNPVRSRELWKDKSLKPIDDQYRVISKFDLKATWLVQNDVLADKELVDKIKSFDKNQELGLFVEVSKDLAYRARVYYPINVEWYNPKAVFLSGYSLTDRKKIIDTMMKDFENTFGYLPKSAGAWWIDSYSQQYLEKKYQIKTVMIVADQKTTDSYGIWGQWWGYPYIPSPDNILVPGFSQTVVIQWAQRDLEKAYMGNGPLVSNFSLQANDYTSQKLNIKYFAKLAGQYLAVEILGQITVGLETGMESVGNEIEYEKQLEWLVDNKIVSLKMSEFGDKYRKIYDDKNPEKVILSDWVMTPTDRTNQKLGERTEYKKDLVFVDNYQKDQSDFLNRIYKPENLVKKRIINWEIVIKLLLVVGSLIVILKWKEMGLILVMVVWLMIWMLIHVRYSVVNGEIMIGFLVDNFRFVGINFKQGLVNTDLSNLVAQSMLRLKL